MIYLFSRIQVDETVESYITVLKNHDSSNTQMVSVYLIHAQFLRDCSKTVFACILEFGMLTLVS